MRKDCPAPEIARLANAPMVATSIAAGQSPFDGVAPGGLIGISILSDDKTNALLELLTSGGGH